VIRLAPFVIEFALLVFCVIDVVQTPEIDIRNLPQWGWIILIIFIPLVGCVAWLVAGRPVRTKTQGWRYGNGFPEGERPQASNAELDRRLEADLARVDREHEEMLRRWEADLARREREAKRARDPEDD
jgi:Phospholipase_D-nuclease N-terminal